MIIKIIKMANDKYIIGLFDHEDKLVHAVRAFKKKGVEITQVLTPFPVHGLENELGFEGSRLHTAGFLFGATGLTLALFMMSWVSVSNYPLNIGGKPFWALPAFIPIMFELTVLFAAVGMVMVYLKRNKLFPGYVPRIYDDRITDDRFALVFEVTDTTTQSDYDTITKLLKDSDVTEIKTKEFEENGEMFSSIEREFVFESASKAPVASVKVETPKVEVVEAVIESAVSEKSEDELKNQLFSEIGVASADTKDDLKKIKGIGKVYEERLNEIGIFTFAQIAKLGHNGIESIESLTGFPGRIEREDWVGQAKLLNEGGNTEFSDRVESGDVY